MDVEGDRQILDRQQILHRACSKAPAGGQHHFHGGIIAAGRGIELEPAGGGGIGGQPGQGLEAFDMGIDGERSAVGFQAKRHPAILAVAPSRVIAKREPVQLLPLHLAHRSPPDRQPLCVGQNAQPVPERRAYREQHEDRRQCTAYDIYIDGR